jgi:hypothetical protein
MKQKTKLLFLAIVSIVLLCSYVGDLGFPPLPKIKAITEWRQWADSSQHENKEPWLKSKREYYPNGELKQSLYVELDGDTTDLRKYELNKDSLTKQEVWYNKYLHKWIKSDYYHYEKGTRVPSYSIDEDKYRVNYTYNQDNQLIDQVLLDDKHKRFAEYEYMYDTTGLLIQKIEYDFFDDKRDLKRIYAYIYARKENGKVWKMDSYFVPFTNEESVTKTDKKGNVKTTYYGFTAKEKSILETIYYNDKGERTQKVEYDREDKPEFIWTYDYEYYP